MTVPKGKGKRSAPPTSGPSKKRKLASNRISQGGVPKKGKEKAADRGTIPIPSVAEQDEVDLSDQDLDVLEEYGQGASFLGHLDRGGIMRSKKETERLHQLNKRERKKAEQDDLPSVDSHDEEDAWSSGIDDDSTDASDTDESLSNQSFGESDDSDVELAYEALRRKRRPIVEKKDNREIQRLPIKLADGRIQKSGNKPVALPDNSEADSGIESETDQDHEEETIEPREDIATGARFGRAAVLDVVGAKSRKQRIEGAKQQIASICQEILSDPEGSLGLLRRLHTFSLEEISSPTRPEPIPNDPVIRKLAILSQLAVFKDIIPGYRIRALTDKAKEEKVSQMVARTREWEQGIVVVYQTFLRGLEAELKARSDLADIALRCMCTLLTSVTHFNFRVNLMTCIISRLSKKSWDKSSELCLNTLISVFREDLTGVASLEIVRLLNRMVKERRFKVHPEVLTCLLHLRLRTELGVRASDSSADKWSSENGEHRKNDRKKGKKAEPQHLNKKAKKALKEKKLIDKEFREAEAEVDKEERSSTHTETLKLLFALYFRILKNPTPTPLLPAALSGISKFAHLVNIDFFKDLMQVLKHLITIESDEVEEDLEEVVTESSKDLKDVSRQLLCIVTAFELLSGQGEALNLDLTDFVGRLYAMILPLTLVHDVDTQLPSFMAGGHRHMDSVEDMLFRALNIIFSPRTFGTSAPPWRSAAFAKRLLTASLHWPPSSAVRALSFVRGLIAKDRKLEALLSSDDRIFDGIYRPDVDDPQLCNPFATSMYEVLAIYQKHWDSKVREEALQLINFSQT